MIPLLIYKNLHLLGVFMILVALGGLILQQIQATTREQVWRKPWPSRMELGWCWRWWADLGCWHVWGSTGHGQGGSL